MTLVFSEPTLSRRLGQKTLPYRSTKTFRGFPCAHRRHAHKGHCKLVHGYDRSFTVVFEADHLEHGTGFVMDFGDLKEVKLWLEEHFDHTLLLDESDPLLPLFNELERVGACKLVVLADVGMEGSAKFVFDHVNKYIQDRTQGRVSVFSVECRENAKNSAIYIRGIDRG